MFLMNSSSRVYTQRVNDVNTLHCAQVFFNIYIFNNRHNCRFQLQDITYYSYKSKFLPVNAMKKSLQVEVQYHPILTSTPGTGEWSASPPSHFNL